MQPDGNQLLKCPSLSINCCDASCFRRTPFLAGTEAVTHRVAASERGWEGLLVGGNQQQPVRQGGGLQRCGEQNWICVGLAVRILGGVVQGNTGHFFSI